MRFSIAALFVAIASTGVLASPAPQQTAAAGGFPFGRIDTEFIACFADDMDTRACQTCCAEIGHRTRQTNERDICANACAAA